MPQSAPPSNQSGVLQQFLANWNKGGGQTQGAGNYNNSGFFNALQRDGLMPTFADLLSSKLNPPDPNDLLRDPMGQGQTLVGLGQVPGQGAAPPPQMDLSQLGGMPQPVAPSPNVAGPLAALARQTPRAKPHIKLKSRPKLKVKPRIKLKSGGLNASVL